MMQLVIPTHNRALKQTTLSQFPERLRRLVMLVPSTTQDYYTLRQLHPDNEVLRIGADGIAEKRHKIMLKLKHAESVFMLDDDMRFFARCPPKYREFLDGRWKIKPDAAARGWLRLKRTYYSDKDWDLLLKIMSAQLSMTYEHMGISSRMGNDLVETDYVENGRMMHAIGYNREAYMRSKYKFNQVRLREDMHVSLGLLRSGKPNYIHYDVAFSPDEYGGPGGCSDERTVELSNDQAKLLASLHPGLVKLKHREYGVSTPRTEVVCSWKKAFNHG